LVTGDEHEDKEREIWNRDHVKVIRRKGFYSKIFQTPSSKIVNWKLKTTLIW